MAGENPDFAQEDLCNAIENGDFPEWDHVHTSNDEEESREFKWNPFDITKVLPQAEFPLIEVSEMNNEILKLFCTCRTIYFFRQVI